MSDLISIQTGTDVIVDFFFFKKSLVDKYHVKLHSLQRIL